jgi:hypothetical protein
MNLKDRAKKIVVRNHWTQMGEERERQRILSLLSNLYEETKTHDTDVWMIAVRQVVSDLTASIEGKTR